MIRTAGREEHPRKLLIPRRLAAASNISPPKRTPPKRAAIKVSAICCWKKLDPPASNASVPNVWNRRPHTRFSSAPLECERGEPNRTKNGRDGAQRACGVEGRLGVNPESPRSAAQSRHGAEKGDS